MIRELRGITGIRGIIAFIIGLVLFFFCLFGVLSDCVVWYFLLFG